MAALPIPPPNHKKDFWAMAKTSPPPLECEERKDNKYNKENEQKCLNITYYLFIKFLDFFPRHLKDNTVLIIIFVKRKKSV